MKLEFALLGLEVFIFGKWFWVLPMCLFFGAMMVTNLPMFSLKMKSYKYSENKTVFNFLIYAIILIVVLQWIAIPLIMFSYVIVSFVIWMKNRNKNEELVTNTSSSLA
jgi:CDP-diacylglycerol--serine O-phosphatidyltransferase